MDPFVGHAAPDHLALFPQDGVHLAVKHQPVVRQGHMNIRPQVKERIDQRCGHIGQAAGLCRHAVRPVSHPLGEIGGFRGHDQDSRIFLLFIHA